MCCTFSPMDSIPVIVRMTSTLATWTSYFMVEDLCMMLLEYFGKHIAQPRRELYEKVTGLPVNPGKTSHGWLAEQEAESAMLVAQQQDLLQQHIAAPAPRSRPSG